MRVFRSEMPIMKFHAGILIACETVNQVSLALEGYIKS